MNYLLFALGLGLLTVSGDRLVVSAVQLGQRFGMSSLAVGVLVVGLGTSLPELATSLDAALQGYPGAAIGNVVGSNIANILLVLGLGALWMPMRVEVRPARRDLPWLLVACAVTLAMVLGGTIERWMGLVLTFGLGIYIWRLLYEPAGVEAGSAGPAATADGIWRAALWSIVAVVGLVGGAHVLVLGAVGIAADFGISESVTGLLLLALGTSLPELTVTVASLLRKQADVAVGNVIGSTLFNLLGILGVTALVTPLPVPQVIADVHIWIMLGAVAIAVLFIRTGWHINRVEGLCLLVAYPVYLAYLMS
ncbi:MAG: calcium/sodium antiporter [Pseudomonadota bacterium]